MTAKQILERISKGEWRTNSIPHVIDKHGDAIVYCNAVFVPIGKREANALAITQAVNATWGNGYDPQKIEEFMQGFELFAKKNTISAFSGGKALFQLFTKCKIK